MKIVKQLDHVYGDFALLHDGNDYYHCFFDKEAEATFGYGILVIDRVTMPVITPDTDLSSWQYMRDPYPDIPWMRVEDCIFNRGVTRQDWERLLTHGESFLVLAALSGEDDDAF